MEWRARPWVGRETRCGRGNRSRVRSDPSRARRSTRRKSRANTLCCAAAREDGGDAGRWLPLGDVVHARGTSVDDVVRERYWILRDYAKRRHLKLNASGGVG